MVIHHTEGHAGDRPSEFRPPATPSMSHEPAGTLPSHIPLTPEQREAWHALCAEVAQQETGMVERTRELTRRNEEKAREFLARADDYLRKLDPSSDRAGRCALDANKIDSIIEKALTLNQNGQYDLLINAACAAFSRCDRGDHLDWSHAVCHNFERYRPDDDRPSLLEFPALQRATEELFEESVRRVMESRTGVDSFTRTLGGVINYALDQVNPSQVDEPFPWKPACLNNDQLVQVLGPESIEGRFCAARTPREFVEGLAVVMTGAQDRFYGPSIPLDLFDAVRTDSNGALIDAAFAKQAAESASDDERPMVTTPPASVGELRAQRDAARAGTVVTPGVFIDVDGTLLGREYRRDDSWVLTDTAARVALFAPGSRVPVTIFTGGDPATATRQLEQLGFPQELLPVRSKAEFRGHLLELVLDDTPPDVQGFAAKEYIDCRRPSGAQWVRLDPFGVMARLEAEPAPPGPAEVPQDLQPAALASSPAQAESDTGSIVARLAKAAARVTIALRRFRVT